MDQHFVPKAYLKGFTDVKNRIWRKQLTSKYATKVKFSSVTGTGYLRDFYRIEGKWRLEGPFENPNCLEDQIRKQFEDNLEKQLLSLTKFISVPTYSARYAFAQTLLHLKRRNQYYRENFYNKHNMREIKDQSLRTLFPRGSSFVNQLAEDNGMTYEQFIDWANTLADGIIDQQDAEKEFHNLSLLNEGNQQRAAHHRVYVNLASAQWTIYEAPLFNGFITSDNPGFLMDQHGAVKNTGFEGHFRFFFPLNSQYLLCISNMSGPNNNMVDIVPIGPKLVGAINSGTSLLANHHIYGRSQAIVEQVIVARSRASGLCKP